MPAKPLQRRLALPQFQVVGASTISWSGCWHAVVLHTRLQQRHTTERRRRPMRCQHASTLCLPSKALTMEVSKAFRAKLPALRADQLEHLRRWSDKNCAHAVLFRDSGGRCVLMALRDRSRTAASHSRTVRAALRLMAIDDGPLRGKWLHLVTPQEALAVGTLDSGVLGAPDPRAEDTVEENDVRVVALR